MARNSGRSTGTSTPLSSFPPPVTHWESFVLIDSAVIQWPLNSPFGSAQWFSLGWQHLRVRMRPSSSTFRLASSRRPRLCARPEAPLLLSPADRLPALAHSCCQVFLFRVLTGMVGRMRHCRLAARGSFFRPPPRASSCRSGVIADPEASDL